jgi:hypothetical protein
VTIGHVARRVLPRFARRHLRRQLLDRGVMGEAAKFYMQNLVALTLLDVYRRALSAYSGKTVIRTAIIGYEPHVFANLEALSDVGLTLGEHFQWQTEVCALPRRRLEDLPARIGDYDLLICCASSAEEERALLGEIRRLFPGPGRPPCPVYRVHYLFHGFCEALASLHRSEFATCLNAKKLAAVATALSIVPEDGCVAECGAYKGGTSILMGLLARRWGRRQPIHAIDTFAGMPDPVAADGNTVYQGGTFGETSYALVRESVSCHGLRDTVLLRQGLIQDVLPGVCGAEGDVAFALIDTDQYQGTLASLMSIVPALKRNGIVLVDDCEVPGVRQAIADTRAAHAALGWTVLTNNLGMLWARTDVSFLSHPL